MWRIVKGFRPAALAVLDNPADSTHDIAPFW
jgi:hypothetical protein